MTKKNSITEITETEFKNLIYEVRGQQVMLDADLAKIYGYSTKAFNQQVKNNIDKFDEDFRFQLNIEEIEIFRSKNLTANINPKNRKCSGGIFHDRYIIIDFGTSTEAIYHCGASSKVGGNKVMSIEKVNDIEIYRSMIQSLTTNSFSYHTNFNVNIF